MSEFTNDDLLSELNSMPGKKGKKKGGKNVNNTNNLQEEVVVLTAIELTRPDVIVESALTLLT